MEDDDREVGWAPRKIRELQKQVDAISTMLGNGFKVSLVEGTVIVESTDFRLNALESAKNRLFELAGQHELRMKSTEADLTGTDKATVLLDDRLSRLERTVGAEWDSEDDPVAEGSSIIEQISDLRRKLGGDRIFGRVARLEKGLDNLTVLHRDVAKVVNRLSRIEQNYVPEAALEDLIGRVRRLEGQTQFETSEGVEARLNRFGATLDELGERSRKAVISTSPGWEGVLKRLNEIESKFNDHLQWAAQHDHPDDLANRLTQLEEALQSYGVPTSVLKPKPIGEVGTDEGKAYWESRRRTYESGLRIGAAMALDNAENRVRAYMSDSFSEGTIAGVLKAIKSPS